MKKTEWHKHFNETMTQLCEAQEQLKIAPHNSIESQEANKEIGARMHEIDCLTNVSLTPIESEDNVGATVNVGRAISSAPGRKPLISFSDLTPRAADLLRDASTSDSRDKYLANFTNPH